MVGRGNAEKRLRRGQGLGLWGPRASLRTIGFYALVVAVMLPTVFVFYWMVTLSLKPQVEAAGYPPSFVRFSVTFKGYQEVFAKHPFLLYTWNSLVVAVGCTVLGLVIGLPAAYSIAHWRQRGLAPFKWTYSSQTVLYALALVDVWEWTPLIMLIALAGLAALPKEPYESALIDGATGLQSFWYITLPLLRPTIIVAILFRSIDALKTFDIIFVMTQGGPANASETLNILLFNQAFSYFNMGYASSMAVALFAIVMGASLILMKVRRGGW